MKVNIPDDHAYLLVDNTGSIKIVAAPNDPVRQEHVPPEWLHAAVVVAYMNPTRTAEAQRIYKRYL